MTPPPRDAVAAAEAAFAAAAALHQRVRSNLAPAVAAAQAIREALGRPGDVAFGISTSGESRNVISALERARERGLKTIALTGRDGGHAGRAADLHVNVPDQNTARVQEVHRTILHVMCELIET